MKLFPVLRRWVRVWDNSRRNILSSSRWKINLVPRVADVDGWCWTRLHLLVHEICIIILLLFVDGLFTGSEKTRSCTCEPGLSRLIGVIQKHFIKSSMFINSALFVYSGAVYKCVMTVHTPAVASSLNLSKILKHLQLMQQCRQPPPTRSTFLTNVALPDPAHRSFCVSRFCVWKFLR